MSNSTLSTQTTRETQVPAGSRLLWELACNVALSLLFLRFAAMHGHGLVHAFRLSTLLVLIKVSTDVVFYLIRRIPRDTSMSLYDWIIGVGGTYAIMLFESNGSGDDLRIGQALQLLGIALQVLAMLSLNRSIGMIPANRGIQTGGLYRYVRHPLYLSYLVAFAGYVINQPTPHNLVIYPTAVVLWVLRLVAEERFLMQDAAYRAFAARTKWRLVPGVY